MKTLIAIVVVQTAILIALFMRVNSLDNDTAQVQRAEPEIVYVQPSSAPQPVSVAAAGYTDEDLLREIIREELAFALEDVRIAVASGATESVQPVQSGRDYDVRRDSVAESIEYYVSAGEISEQEMARLQMDIARLNPDDRQAMMGAVVRAMNTGQLNGRL